jgi:magnesium transporter
MPQPLILAGLTWQGTTFKNKEITLQEISQRLAECKTAWIDIVVEDVSASIRDVIKQLGIAYDPTSLLGGYLSNYEDLGELLALMVPILTFKGGAVTPSPVVILVKRGQVFVIHEPSNRLQRFSEHIEIFLRRLPKGEEAWADRNTLLLWRLLDEIAEQNFIVLRDLVERAEELQIRLSEAKEFPRDLSRELSSIKRAIMAFLNAMWATHETIHTLKSGDPEMVSDKERVLARFDMILASIDRQIQMAEHTLEILAAGINVVQTSLANRLAGIITILTVIFTLSIPGTLIGTFYGMNVNLPGGIESPWDFLGPYTTFIVLVLTSLASAVALLWYFRRVGWLFSV